MSGRAFMLDGRDPVPCTLREWSEWFEAHVDDPKRVVGFDQGLAGGASVVTSFVGLLPDCLSDDATPLVFETLVRGGAHHGAGERYATWEAAEAGHRSYVAMVQGHAS